MMKSAVITFPGSNCDRDAVVALQKVSTKIQRLWHTETSLDNDLDLIVVPGGFSFGDYLRSGAIARFSPIMTSVIEHANNGGFVFGVCNGFQILCEAGLTPGALLHNNSQKFICKNVFIKPENNSTIITSELDINKALKIPIAHGEGRFFADANTLNNLNENGQILFRYSDENGVVKLLK